jgi:hypothetical protein
MAAKTKANFFIATPGARFLSGRKMTKASVRVKRIFMNDRSGSGTFLRSRRSAAQHSFEGMAIRIDSTFPILEGATPVYGRDEKTRWFARRAEARCALAATLRKRASERRDNACQYEIDSLLADAAIATAAFRCAPTWNISGSSRANRAVPENRLSVRRIVLAVSKSTRACRDERHNKLRR